MLKTIVTLAALASCPSLAIAQATVVPAYPFTQVLPVPGWNSTTDGFNSLGNLYLSSASQLSAQAVALAQKNVELSGSGGVQYNYDVKAGLSSSLVTLNNLFWQTAYQTEQKVCAIATSINQQNVNTVQGNLRAGVSAEAQAVIAITVTLTNTVLAVKAQLTSFTDAERAVIAALIQAIATAATASVGPVAALNTGLTATGVTALTEAVQSLQAAIVALQAAATINWTIT